MVAAATGSKPGRGWEGCNEGKGWKEEADNSHRLQCRMNWLPEGGVESTVALKTRRPIVLFHRVLSEGSPWMSGPPPAALPSSKTGTGLM